MVFFSFFLMENFLVSKFERQNIPKRDGESQKATFFKVQKNKLPRRKVC
jgi:hypothetical protein